MMLGMYVPCLREVSLDQLFIFLSIHSLTEQTQESTRYKTHRDRLEGEGMHAE